jgi:beta-N-acetylhexosaminidase
MTTTAQLPPAVLDKFVLGFEGTSLPDELRELLARGLAGVIIFPRNFSSAEGLRTLSDEIRAAAGRPVLISIDQEGGPRFSLPKPFTQWPSAAELGELGSPELVERQARAMALELRAVGCNLDFAPMLDLHLQPGSPVTTDRSFGPDPHQVGRLGVAFARGLAAEGVLACGKHFPGHGDTQVDPHEDLPVFGGDAARLDRIELAPFAAVIQSGVPLLMTAHILLPKIDGARPATLSRKILRGILRDRLGFRGAILADDLGMGAIRKRWPAPEAAIQTFQAGSDLTLLCHDWTIVRPTLDRVARALEQGEFNETEWKESHKRIQQLLKLTEASPQTPSLDVVGCAEHRALVREIRARVAKMASPSRHTPVR